MPGGPGPVYPLFTMYGEEVYQVAVGPVHAGVIEPGHFRFQCHWKVVHHLEIHLSPGTWAWPWRRPMRWSPPKLVIAVGGCAISGGPVRDHPQVANGADAVVPVDLYVPGCPPHPFTILDGLLGRMEEQGRPRS